MPTIHQIFGDNPAEYPLTACRGVGFLLLRAVCSGNGFRRQRRPCLVADQLLGNSVGAIESAAHAIIAFSLDRVAAWGASASPCLVKLAPFGGSASELRLSGLR
jgi:hypothetical protein